MADLRKTFTTTQVARIVGCAPRTVAKWFDTGHLVGFLLPGTKHRRIPREHLVNFLTQNHLPLDGLERLDDAACRA